MSAPTLPWVLGSAWGVVLAWPVRRRAARVGAVARAAALSAPHERHARRWWRVTGWLPARRRLEHSAVIRVARALHSRGAVRRADVALVRELPVALDLLGVAVGAGCTPYLAVGVAAEWSPEPLAAAFGDVLRRCALGLDLEAALGEVSRARPRLLPVADALLATDRLGVPVGPVLARLADEDRTALRRAAETQARRIPVRLLFPLVFLVLPAFVLLTVVPGLAAGLGRL